MQIVCYVNGEYPQAEKSGGVLPLSTYRLHIQVLHLHFRTFYLLIYLCPLFKFVF